MELKEIKTEDLLFSNEMEDDRTNTFLSLDDYDLFVYGCRTNKRWKNRKI